MRKIEAAQMQMGQFDISQIRFNPKSRDDIPQIKNSADAGTRNFG